MTDLSATEEHRIALEHIPSSRLRSNLNLSLLIISFFAMLPLHLLLYPLGRRIWRPYATVWFRIACRLFGMRIRVKGQQTTDRPALLVSNHISYLDIPLFGAVTNATFISRADVANWPIFGFLAKITNTVFIERTPSKIRAQRQLLANRLNKGQTLLLFAEGTSTRGAEVLPFKSALFGVMDVLPKDNPLTIQPISIAYVRMRGRTDASLNDIQRVLYGWYGDMELVPHLKAALGLRGVEVEVTFHEPQSAHDFDNRKELAAYSHGQVRKGLALSLRPSDTDSNAEIKKSA